MIKEYLALSPKFLSRLSYHFIWGLGLDRKGRKNFYEIVQELHVNAELLETITNETNKILNSRGIFGGIFRIFCWIFNINQYCQNYYKLQAYYSWRKYEEGIIMFSNADRQEIDAQGGFIEKNELNQSILGNIYDSARYCVEPVKFCVVTPFVWVSVGIRTIFFKNETSPSLREVIISQDTHFMVDSQAQRYLKILGIEAEIDSQFAIISIKQRYKKLCIVHHPDKGGNADTFRAITDAYKDLEEHISSDKDIFGLKAKFEEHFADWRKEHEEADCCIRSADESTKELAEATQSMVEATQSMVEATQSMVEATQSMVEERQRAAEERQSATEARQRLAAAIIASRKLREECEKRSEASKKKLQDDLVASASGLCIDEPKNRYSPTMFQTQNKSQEQNIINQCLLQK